MKSIKYRILVNFCAIAAISIIVLAVTVSERIRYSLSQLSEKLSADMITREFETLNLPHQTFDILIREEIRRSIGDLSQNSILIDDLEASRLKALRARLQETVVKDGLDFAILLNLKGQLLASFPSGLNDFDVEDYFKSWEFGAYIMETIKNNASDGQPVRETFTRYSPQALQTLGVQTSEQGETDEALGIAAANFIQDDFGEDIGICVIGKSLNDHNKPLEHLHAIAGYASAIYLDSTPIAYAGFDERQNDPSAFQIPSDFLQDVYRADASVTKTLLFDGEPYLSACSSLASFTDEHVGVFCVGLPESHVADARQAILSHGSNTQKSVQQWILGIGAISLSFFAVVSLMVATKIVTPLKQLSQYAKRIALGDFQEKISLTSRDEIGDLNTSLNEVVDSFREISTTSEAIAVGKLHTHVSPRSEYDTLGNALQYMSEYLREMASMAEAIARGNLTGTIHVRSGDDTFGQALQFMTEGLRALIAQIKTSVAQLTETESTISSLAADDIHIVSDAHSAVEEVTATMTEMGNSVQEVSQNIEILSTSVEATSSSASQMAASSEDIATNTTSLTRQAYQAIESMQNSIDSLENIVKNTDTSEQLSQETMQDALKGQQAVEQVMSSMETIQQTITLAVDAITQFSQRSREIDTILDVIREITDQTSLLALNASIIAAQAGEHGRGFAVVADEIKSLANGVSESTKEIATIVHSLQQDTNTVIQTVHNGAADVEQGMIRTQQAREALNKISSSAQRSSTIVSEITDALHGLMTLNHNVFSTMEQVNIMTSDITGATNDQKTGTRQIHQSISRINEMASHIQIAATEQLSAVRQVLQATHDLAALIDRNLESSRQITHTAEDLSSQAVVLLHSVERFTLESDTRDRLQRTSS